MSEDTVGEPSIPLSLRKTHRPGLPQLWGVAEMTAYANQVADRLGKPRPGTGRAWTWYRIAGFPAPVAQLEMGGVWLAAELVPWIDERMAMDRFSNTPIDEATKRAILDDEGKLSATRAAQKYGVSESSVRRIWTGRR